VFRFLLRLGLRTIDRLMISSHPPSLFRFALHSRDHASLVCNGGGGSDKLPSYWPQKEAIPMSEVIHEMSSGVGLAWDTGWALSFTALFFFLHSY
jgi:hypothetical protein